MKEQNLDPTKISRYTVIVRLYQGIGIEGSVHNLWNKLHVNYQSLDSWNYQAWLGYTGKSERPN